MVIPAFPDPLFLIFKDILFNSFVAESQSSGSKVRFQADDSFILGKNKTSNTTVNNTVITVLIIISRCT
jgi:hypothetical protein